MTGLLVENPGVPPKVMVICDDPETGYVWLHILKKRGLDVLLTESPSEALRQKEKNPPDLVVIDEHAQKLDGIDLIKKLRAGTIFPILLLTFRNEHHILGAYAAGADDCVREPVSPAMFLARVQANLRRARCVPLESLTILEVPGFRLDPRNRELSMGNGTTVKLSQLEFRLLHLLMQNPGWIHAADEIIERVWGYSGEGNKHLLKHVVFRLRRKIETDPSKPKHIKTDPGGGYWFDTDE